MNADQSTHDAFSIPKYLQAPKTASKLCDKRFLKIRDSIKLGIAWEPLKNQQLQKYSNSDSHDYIVEHSTWVKVITSTLWSVMRFKGIQRLLLSSNKQEFNTWIRSITPNKSPISLILSAGERRGSAGKCMESIIFFPSLLLLEVGGSGRDLEAPVIVQHAHASSLALRPKRSQWRARGR